jgi:hypothetical protein
VYSPSYGVPVLLITGRRAAPPADVLGHAELTELLLRAAGGSASDDDDGSRRRDMLFVSGLGGGGGGAELTAFAPWEHPHLGSAGCWLGVHPCQTSAVMAMLLSTVDSVASVESVVEAADSVSSVAPVASVESVASVEAVASVALVVEAAAADPTTLRYMLAWVRLAAAAVADLSIPPSLRGGLRRHIH